VPRSANNPPRPSGGTACLTTLFLLEAKLLTWRLQDQFSKSCSPLSYNGYFCCQNAVLPGRQRFPGDSPPTPRRLPADYPSTTRLLPRRPPTRSLGDKQTIENQCVYCIIATWTPRTTQLTPRSFQMTPRSFQMTPGSSQTTLWSSQRTSLVCQFPGVATRQGRLAEDRYCARASGPSRRSKGGAVRLAR